MNVEKDLEGEKMKTDKKYCNRCGRFTLFTLDEEDNDWYCDECHRRY
jgi:ribosomal protein S27AE